MGFTSVGLYNFRNLVNGRIDTPRKTVFLVGENGQGKTNFLEALYILCFGSSFRTTNNRLLIRRKEKEMSVRGSFFSSQLQQEITTELKIQGGKKEIWLNGKKVKDRKELINTIPCIVFCHDDISFVTGPPEMRRRFINQTMALFNPLFIDSLRGYSKVVKMRNSELRQPTGTPLDILEQQIAVKGLQIQREREKIITEFNETFATTYSRVEAKNSAGEEEPVVIRYRPSWKNCDTAEDICRQLKESREADRENGYTRSGPHRDRIVFTRKGYDFSQTASTGQLRLLSLSLKVAQAVFFYSKTGREPVLLLDDVLLELDGERKNAFVQILPPFEQAFFTFLPDEHFHHFYKKEGTLVYTVREGSITE